ncbi:hypothetical protein EDC44_13122 [Cricetibacter osteomyelitidis]|uniref:Uncharacterized protein n=1 Tax=Cricetibacter osteomyelitidis TaxID=1521931 RepID=A0A4R2SSH6_9PAST|nr:hypothetical protein [Cricetibacter osteomyelitidis]TCP91316.1 hypothetical protein EDC44_13122 [Cricetibacter osteomyelitidis]
MTVTVKVLNAKKEIASHKVEKNQSITINATDKSNYQIINDETGFAPQNIIAKRVGKDLQITLEDGNLTPDIVIQNYYGEGNPEEVTNLIVGQHENGKTYAYVPESGEKSDAVSMLDDADAASQSLGGDELASPFWVFSPWWLLALVPLAAGIAIAASHNSSSGDAAKDTTADAPTVAPSKTDGSVTVTSGTDNKKVEITFTGEDNQSKTVTATKGADGTWTLDDPNNTGATIDPKTGVITIPQDSVKDGSEVTAKGTDGNGNTENAKGTAGTDSIEKADQPTAILVEKGGNKTGGVTVTPNPTNKGVEITYTDENDQPQTITATKGDDGTWTLDKTPTGVSINPNTGEITFTPDAVKDDSKVEVKGTEPGKKPSDPVEVTTPPYDDTDGDGKPDSDTPDDKVPADKEKDTDDDNDGVNNADEKANGTDPKNTDSDGDGTPDGEEDTDGDGIKDGDESDDDSTGITDKDGNGIPDLKDPATLTVDLENNITHENVARALITGTSTQLPEGTVISITITDKNGKEVKATATVGKDGKYSATADLSSLADGAVTAVAIANDGKVEATDESPNTLDKTVPLENADQPTIELAEKGGHKTGGVTVTPNPTNKGVEITYTDENDQPQTITATKGDDGTWTLDKTPTGVSINPNTGEITFTPDAVKDDSKVEVKGTEPGKKPSDPVEVTTPPYDDTDGDGKPDSDTPDDKVPADKEKDTDDDNDGVNNADEKANGTDPKNTDSDGDGTPDGEEDTDGDGIKDGDESDDDSTGITDKDGNGIPDLKDPATLTVDLENNITHENVAKAPISGTSTQLPANTEITITITDKEGKAVTVTATTDDKGNYSTTADLSGLADGTVTAVATANEGKVRAEDKSPNTLDTSADEPTVTPATDNGSVEVTPGGDNEKVEITFTDEDNQPKTVTATKQPDGTWKLDTPDDTGATVKDGKVIIPQDSVKDGSDVTAKGTDDKGNIATDTDKAGTDSKDAGVDDKDTDGDGKSNGVVTMTPVDEGNALVTTVKLTNNNGNDALPFSRSGTAEDADLGELKFSNGVTLNSDGKTLKVPAGVKEFTITTPTIEDNKTEGNETVKYTVGGVEGNEATINDTSKSTPATSITKITLGDNFTDDFGVNDVRTEGADITTNYYNGNDSKYVGDVKSGSGNAAISLDTGLTNDATPTLNFTLDKPLADNQTVELKRYTLINGERGNTEDLTGKLVAPTDKQNYTLTDDLAETYGTDYEYELVLKTDGKETVTKTHQFRLDTMVESMEVSEFKVDTKSNSATIVFKATGNSEINSTLTAKYPVGGGNMQEAAAVYNETDGTYTLTLTNYDRYNTAGVTLTTVDAAGNVNTQHVVALRNLFTELSTEQGPNPANKDAYDDGLITTLIANKKQAANTASAADGGLVATDGNDTIIIGLEQFGGFGVGNGAIGASASDTNNKAPFKVDTGAGDDFIQVRGDLQSFKGGTFKMGAGNDKLVISGGMVVGEYAFDLGEGNNLLRVNKSVVNALTLSVNAGAGNDSLYFGDNWDGKKTVELGDGNNSIYVGGYIAGAQESSIHFGKDDDSLVVTGNVNAPNTTIDFKGGNNYLKVGEDLISTTINAVEGDSDSIGNNNFNIADDFTNSKIISGSGNDVVTVGNHIEGASSSISLGAGDDTLTVKLLGNAGTLAAAPQIDMGEGNDSVSITDQFTRGVVNLGAGDDTISVEKFFTSSGKKDTLYVDGGDGNDTLVLKGANAEVSSQRFGNIETIDLTANTKQTLTLRIDDLLSDNSKETTVLGGKEDSVKLEGKGNWAQTGSKEVDGVTFYEYTHNNGGTVTDEKVFIQEGIQIL